MSLVEIFLSMGVVLFLAAGVISWNDRKNDTESRNVAQNVYFDKIERTLLKIDENQVKDSETIEAVVAGVKIQDDKLKEFEERITHAERNQRADHAESDRVRDRQNFKINLVSDRLSAIEKRIEARRKEIEERKKAREFPQPTAVDLVRKPASKKLGKGFQEVREGK